jgi:hypothetical protein
MKSIITTFLFLASLNLFSQSNNTIYGIVRQNFFSYVYNPIDSSIISQQFDSSALRLGEINPITGYVSNSGSFAFNESLNLTGASLNPYDNTFIFIGANGINTLELNNGTRINNVTLSNPNGQSFFDNFRFNNADSTMYGLARRNITDSISGLTSGAIYLAKANTTTGVITEISQSSVATGFALVGSVIDPHQMVFYFSTGSNIMGLDIYDGSIFSNVPFNNPNGFAFDNFTYSCADSSIYGLIRQNYYSYINVGGDSIQQYDSSSIKLGKINPTTGLVTAVSPYSIASGGYSLNAGATVDPDAMVYYFGNGTSIIGVSLITGLLVSSPAYTFESGLYFDLMRNNQNCISARANRFASFATNSNSNFKLGNLKIHPNPTNGVFEISSNDQISLVEINSIEGKLLKQEKSFTNRISLDINEFPNGIYFAKVIFPNKKSEVKKIIKY